MAVDMSIWLTQFLKAMRDDEGKAVKNAHLIGTFRRIVKVSNPVLPVRMQNSTYRAELLYHSSTII